jgi:hypothetical protein
MQECIDDLDDEDKSALCHVETTPELLNALCTTPRKVHQTLGASPFTWSDGTVRREAQMYPPLT